MTTTLRGYPARFDYSGSADMFPDLYTRTGQTVQVLVRLGPEEVDETEVGPMFRVRWPDGHEYSVWRDELLCLHDGEQGASDCIITAADRDYPPGRKDA